MALGQHTVQPSAHRATAGDDWRLGVTLYDGGAAFDASGASINAYVLDRDRERVLGPVAQSSNTTGADWATGVVVVAVAAALTEGVAAADDLVVELQVTKSGVQRSWRFGLDVAGLL
jgi:hypothetical protein